MGESPGERTPQRKILIGLVLLVPMSAFGGFMTSSERQSWLSGALFIGATMLLGILVFVIEWLWELRRSRRDR